MKKHIAQLLTLLILLAPPLATTGCGFRPLYGQNHEVGESLSQVDIEPQRGKNGQKLNLLLEDRFYSLEGKTQQPLWRLHLSTTTEKENLGINSDEDTATRIRIRAVATIALYKAGETHPSLETKVRAIASYNILTDPYATLAAEEDAIDRTLTRLANQITNRTAMFLAAQKADIPMSR